MKNASHHIGQKSYRETYHTVTQLFELACCCSDTDLDHAQYSKTAVHHVTMSEWWLEVGGLAVWWESVCGGNCEWSVGDGGFK